MFAEFFVYYRLACLVNFVGMILFSAIRRPCCFLKVTSLTFFGSNQKILLQPTTSSIFGAAISKKSAVQCNLLQWERHISELPTPKFVEVYRIPFHDIDHFFYGMEFLVVLNQPSCRIFSVKNEC